MPMSDDLAGASLNLAQKSMELSVELIKMLAPLAQKLWDKLNEGKADKLQTGEIPRVGLIAEAGKAKSAIMSTGNFLSGDAKNFAEKAQKYGIPVSIVGDGEKVTVDYLERDTSVIKQIESEILAERLQERPQEFKQFKISEENTAAMKSAFEENGIECQFIGSANGEIYCAYLAKDAEKVDLIKQDFKAAAAEVEQNFKVTANAPETARQLEIKEQIAEFENPQDSPELRNQFYEEFAANPQKFVAHPENEFYTYSPKNMEIVHNAMPDAKKVADKAFWEEQGFELKEDAKGIEVVKPVIDKDGKATFTDTTTVYDISQTNAFEKSFAQISADKINELRAEYEAEKISAFENSEDKTVVISDELSGKSVEISADSDLRKSDVVAVLEEDLGYSHVQAELAANKLADDLRLGENYFAQPNQLDSVKVLKSNIRYESDSVLMRDLTFTAVNFDSEHTHISIINGDKSIGLTPAKMTREEMKNICITELGMGEEQATEAVNKAVKIDAQINSKLHETTIFRDNSVRQTIEIERNSQNSFMVKAGTTTKVYDFTQINLDKSIAEDFGIPVKNAQHIVQKAGNQSVIQNKIRANSEKKRKLAKAKIDPLKTQNTGGKKVKR